MKRYSVTGSSSIDFVLQLVDNIVGFMFAGFDTTAISLTVVLLLLAQHPDVQEKYVD